MPGLSKRSGPGVRLVGTPCVVLAFGVGLARFEVGLLVGRGVLAGMGVVWWRSVPVVSTAPEPGDWLRSPSTTEMVTIPPSTIHSSLRWIRRPFGRFIADSTIVGPSIISSTIADWSIIWNP